MKVLVLSTSPRAGLTLRFSQYLVRLLTETHPDLKVSLIDFREFDLRPSGKGNFPDQDSPFQQNLLKQWAEARLIVFCSPEYNWTASAETFVLMERLGSRQFRNYFENKVFAVAGVSSGRGGRQPALDISRVLSKIIGFIPVESIVSSKILEVHDTGMNLDEHSLSRGNPVFEQAAGEFADYSIRLADRWMRSESPAR
jgi:chromate reductase